ncbi:hypothetical protein C2E21_0902 [Chlorella sorokiniana]|uniref:Uncharacterized protein n=1 Tax=Chlorella sorokiniana TaxID=3076 RepID=A0A2P6U249_CHLSO|nr:hypothetical protein C2E21_0902 [Chlorella sorokiniana]|eukprot:PRW60382.1 hypothetical protein C2E21_0902 [Chlorella sorokiniana]
MASPKKLKGASGAAVAVHGGPNASSDAGAAHVGKHRLFSTAMALELQQGVAPEAPAAGAALPKAHPKAPCHAAQALPLEPPPLIEVGSGGLLGEAVPAAVAGAQPAATQQAACAYPEPAGGSAAAPVAGQGVAAAAGEGLAAAAPAAAADAADPAAALLPGLDSDLSLLSVSAGGQLSEEERPAAPEPWPEFSSSAQPYEPHPLAVPLDKDVKQWLEQYTRVPLIWWQCAICTVLVVLASGHFRGALGCAHHLLLFYNLAAIAVWAEQAYPEVRTAAQELALIAACLNGLSMQHPDAWDESEAAANALRWQLQRKLVEAYELLEGMLDDLPTKSLDSMQQNVAFPDLSQMLLYAKP